MTEELKQKAEEYARKTLSKDCCDLKLEVYKKVIRAYIAGATENTELLSKHILELQADKGKLIDENRQAKEILRKILSFFDGEKTGIFAKAEAFLNKE